MGKKFFDKSKSVTYRLVHRETGPDEFEEDKPKYTFVLVPNKKHKAPSKIRALFEENTEKPQAAERVYPSKGPRPDWDPDVVACLDDDFDFEDPENALEDDFVEKANAGVSKEKIVPRRFKHDKKEVEDGDDEGSICSDFSGAFSDDESFAFNRGPKSRTTQYSMTSAISNCTEDVKLLNDKFEKLLEEYDDDQIGALDDEDIDGKGVTAENHTMEEFLLSKDKKNSFLPEKCEEDLKDKILEKAVIADEKPEDLVTIVVEKKRSADSISIAGSCTSSMYNQPAVIPVERQRTSSSSTVRSLSRAQDIGQTDKRNDLRKLAAMNSCRHKDETPEERKERKQLVKAARKENRQLKKEVKLAFKDEKKKQSFEKANAQNMLGFKL